MVAVSMEALRELMVTLDLRINQFESALNSLFIVGLERVSPPDRLEQANTLIRFADQLVISLEKILSRVKEARDKAKQAKERFVRVQGPRLGLNSV